MRNYIILNGRNSKEIQGLIIQELAPITKPARKTETIDIDGADGDIVTMSGYSAYDKTISIGLYGDYRIDDIIEFLDSAGTVTFSNEADRYYNYVIYNQIDFNRLVRFRTADVTLHVQPFKNAANEPPATWTNSGSQTFAELNIKNIGNVIARPVLEIRASGHIIIDVDNETKLKADLPEGTTAIIDCEKMNAFDADGNYINRVFTGDYKDLYIPPGNHSIKVGGAIDFVSIKKYIRWI